MPVLLLILEGIRKPALGNSPGDCCNRRGPPAGGESHPLRQISTVILIQSHGALFMSQNQRIPAYSTYILFYSFPSGVLFHWGIACFKCLTSNTNYSYRAIYGGIVWNMRLTCNWWSYRVNCEADSQFQTSLLGSDSLIDIRLKMRNSLLVKSLNISIFFWYSSSAKDNYLVCPGT